MAPNPIMFAMANPDPEIAYDLAVRTRPDAIVATGRSDFPNQVNNVLGFPFIFRGALDVRATTINDEMKLAATRALAALAKEDVPDSVRRAYDVEHMEFGREYIIPKPFDPRVLIWEASAVAQAAMETGVAQIADRPGRIPRAARTAAGQGARIHARDGAQGAAASASASSFPRATKTRSCAPARSCWTKRSRCPILLGDEAKIRRKHGGTAPAPERRRDHRSGEIAVDVRSYTEEHLSCCGSARA